MTDPLRSLSGLADSLASILTVMVAIAACTSPSSAQDFRTSVVGTDYDFITDEDPSVFKRLKFVGKGPAEMPDKREDRELFQPAYHFAATYTDGTQVELFVDTAIGEKQAARADAMRYATRLGKLPTVLRRGVNRVVVHSGGPDTTAFSDIGLIVLYSANATKRIETHDLEETLFHESIHAAWDKDHARSPGWRRAQASDVNFITDYARRKPDLEDLAESALFAYTLTHHADRIPRPDALRIRNAIPARIAYVAALIPADEPIFFDVNDSEE